MVSRSQAHLLLSCDSFRTLDDHAARNATHEASLSSNVDLPDQAGRRGAVELQLEAFVQDGLLISYFDLLAEIREIGRRAAEEDEPEILIATVGIPTCDRPEALKRALSSYAENVTRSGRRPECVVMDDAPGDGSVSREVLREWSDRHGLLIRYASRDRRRQFADRLAERTGIPSHLVRFALLGDDRFGKTYGSTRNALLLDSAGLVTVQADDDTVCEVAMPPAAEDGLALTSLTDANELRFYASYDEAAAAATAVDSDILGIHERLLGRKLSACLRSANESGEAVDAATVDYDFRENMEGRGAHIAVSFVGILGDAGAGYPYRFLHGGETLNRLLATEDTYRLGMTTRQMIKSTRRPTISSGAFCMTTNMGIDLRELVPPFVPVLRNEDGVFGSLLSAYFPGAYSGYVPYTVSHVPTESRPTSHEDMPGQFQAPLTNGLLTWIIMSFRDHDVGNDEARNLRGVGRALRDLGALPLERFEDRVRDVAVRAIHNNVSHAEQQLERRSPAPSYWLKDVHAYLKSSRQAVVGSDFCVPSDLPGTHAERMALLRELVDRYGTLLTVWPELFEAAMELREQGLRLSEPI